MYVEPTDESEIHNIVSNLKLTKFSGYDGYLPQIIKYVIKDIAKPLTHIFNLSLSTGVFPTSLKLPELFRSSNLMIDWP